MRALGIDVGSKRIGVALSDHLGFLAAPLKAVAVRRGHELAEIAALVREREIDTVVIGLPTSLDGSEGPQALRVRAFAERLAPHLGAIPIAFADVTTWLARSQSSTVSPSRSGSDPSSTKARPSCVVPRLSSRTKSSSTFRYW